MTRVSYTLNGSTVTLPCCVSAPCLRVRNLSVEYYGKKVLSNVSLDINSGCITALIGPSGCGKSSFLSTLNRLTDLIPGAKVEGTVELNGQNVFSRSLNVLGLRRDIGMIFQKPNPFPLSIWKNMELPLREQGVSNKYILQELIETALRDVGLWEEVKNDLNRSALFLSGGQQQRLCIARALVLKPKILLMDEPCSALDPIASEVVERLIMSLQGAYTVVIVTHNLAQARRIANYAGFFWVKENIGTLVEFDQSKRLFDEPINPLTAAYVSGASG
ncbi:MAG: phosphate ABC transporter ATP-binding protein [Pseudomonadota bacterium]